MADQSSDRPEDSLDQELPEYDESPPDKKLSSTQAKSQFKTPRDQYIYSEKELSDADLAKIWKCKKNQIVKSRAEDLARGFDWKQQREQFWKYLSTRIGEVIERSTVEEADETASAHRNMVKQVTDRLANPNLDESLDTLASVDPKEYLNCLKILASTVKICADVEEKLTGGKLLQQSFEQRMKDMDWFAEVVLTNVRDPSVIEKIVRALQKRRHTQQIVAVEDYAEQIAYARGVSTEDVVDKSKIEVKRLTDGEDE